MFKMIGYNVPIYQLIYCQLIILQHVELKYEKKFSVIRCKSVYTYFLGHPVHLTGVHQLDN